MRSVLCALGLLWVSLFSAQAPASEVCTGKFPNLVTDYCWSCAFPIKMFGSMSLVSDGQDDFDGIGGSQPICACSNQLKVGIPVSFWEAALMVDVPTAPGCFPLLGGVSVDVGVNKDAYGMITDDVSSDIGVTRTSFRHVNLYINPVLYVAGILLDDACLDNRAFDVPWVSFADPTHNDDELAGILTPYAFPFSSMVAIKGMTADAVASLTGMPLNTIFWAAGAEGHLYPLTGNNGAHMSNERSARLQAYRVLAKLHAAGTQWSTYGTDGMCGYYPQLIMDKRQYKFERLLPFPQTKKIAGKCCDPMGRSTLLVESATEAPLSSFKDFGYAIFRKRDCCSGVQP